MREASACSFLSSLTPSSLHSWYEFYYQHGFCVTTTCQQHGPHDVLGINLFRMSQQCRCAARMCIHDLAMYGQTLSGMANHSNKLPKLNKLLLYHMWRDSMVHWSIPCHAIQYCNMVQQSQHTPRQNIHRNGELQSNLHPNLTRASANLFHLRLRLWPPAPLKAQW